MLKNSIKYIAIPPFEFFYLSQKGYDLVISKIFKNVNINSFLEKKIKNFKIITNYKKKNFFFTHLTLLPNLEARLY